MSTGQSGDSGAGTSFATARAGYWPSVRQFNIFVENRIGGLMNVVRRFETTDTFIVSLTVVDSADCAIIRLVPSDPERAYEILKQAGLPFAESDLLVIKLPEGASAAAANLQGPASGGGEYPLRLSPFGGAQRQSGPGDSR